MERSRGVCSESCGRVQMVMGRSYYAQVDAIPLVLTALPEPEPADLRPGTQQENRDRIADISREGRRDDRQDKQEDDGLGTGDATTTTDCGEKGAWCSGD